MRFQSLSVPVKVKLAMHSNWVLHLDAASPLRMCQAPMVMLFFIVLVGMHDSGLQSFMKSVLDLGGMFWMSA